jgi:4-hydroxythreonine-4-phosphate dehydrogenase
VKPQRFALTPGEPAGIGPDLCLLLASQSQPHPLIAITSRDLLLERAAQLGVAVSLLPVTPDSWPDNPRLLAACMSGIPRCRSRSSPGN